MSKILDFVRGGGGQQPQQPQINQREAQNQWQRFLQQYGNCNPEQMLEQMIQQRQITPQQRDFVMNAAKMMTDFFHL